MRTRTVAQLRATRPEDFKDPIPLIDYEIALNHKWLSLLPDSKSKTAAEEEAAAAAAAAEEEGEVGIAKAKAMQALKNFALKAQKKAHGWTRKHRVALKDVLEEGQLYDFQNISLDDVKKVRRSGCSTAGAQL